jgi:predicted regulator of Ras-like GTPase activity (Roadblock/LC7/MglB family)
VPLTAPAQGLQQMIGEFAARAEVVVAVLASGDGLLITASEDVDRDHADELAAIACGLVSIVAGSTARMFGDDRVELAVARLTHRTLLVRPVADGSVLAVVATADAQVGSTGDAMAELTEQIDKLLTEDVREELQAALPW